MISPAPTPEDLRDMVVEAVNAGDPGVLSRTRGVHVPDRLVDWVGAVLERRPCTVATRGELRGLPVAVVWVPNRSNQYVEIGHLEFEIEEGVAHLAAVDGSDPDLVSESPTAHLPSG